jgi:hypothetical protein
MFSSKFFPPLSDGAFIRNPSDRSETNEIGGRQVLDGKEG